MSKQRSNRREVSERTLERDMRRVRRQASKLRAALRAIHQLQGEQRYYEENAELFGQETARHLSELTAQRLQVAQERLAGARASARQQVG